MAKPTRRTELAAALVVTAEVSGHELSPIAAEAMADELVKYPAPAVAEALKRCQRELTSRLTLAAVLARIDDGHPGVEQAWALCTTDEGKTIVWTELVAEAFGTVHDLLVADDMIGARMAFKERYAELLLEARRKRETAKWTVSLGHDVNGRTTAVRAGVEAGRLAPEYAHALLGPGALDKPEVLGPRLASGQPTSIAGALPAVGTPTADASEAERERRIADLQDRMRHERYLLDISTPETRARIERNLERLHEELDQLRGTEAA